MCQQHMKHWCNNVDWSLESVFLNINNRVWFKQNWDGDPFLLEHLNWDGDPFQIINQNCNRLNSHIWAKMFIKWDRFLGKFKKGPPRIGEYDKK